MAPREALQNVQYNILASAEAGLPVSKAPSTTLLLQPPLHGAPHKRSVKPRLTGNIITLWGLVCLLLLSLTVLTKNFSYVVLPNDQNATLFDATELSSDDTLKNKLHRLSDSLATDTTSIVVDARAKPKGTHSNNERVTLEEKTQNNQEKEDKLLRDAISQLVQRPWPKCLPPVEVLPKSPDSCADYTQTPKVAILFLTRGNLFHEPIWKEWFRSVAGLLPEESVAAALDDENKLKNVEEICRSEGIKNTNETDIIASQHLFNVYIHAPPSFNGKKQQEKDYKKLSLKNILFTLANSFLSHSVASLFLSSSNFLQNLSLVLFGKTISFNTVSTLAGAVQISFKPLAFFSGKHFGTPPINVLFFLAKPMFLSSTLLYSTDN